MWFESWTGVGRVALAAVVVYAALIATLRLSGKRTLAKLNAFDLVVTIALGSTLSSIVVSSDVALVEGLTAIVGLVSLQVLLAFASSRVGPVRRVVQAEPAVLLRAGVLLSDEMARQRITRADLEQAVRAAGMGGFELVAFVVLEGDGSLSVIPRSDAGSASAMPRGSDL